MASIVGRIYSGANPDGLMQEIVARLDQPAQAAGAWLDLSILRRSFGDFEKAEIFQSEALGTSRIFRQPSSAEKPLRLLAFKTAGNFMSNTPLEFMIEGSNVEVISVYLNEETQEIGPVPKHDVALLAIGESPDSRKVLHRCKELLQNWPCEILNFNVDTILKLDRALLWRFLADAKALYCPWTQEFVGADLRQDPHGAISRRIEGEQVTFPLIVRPEGAHAGTNTFKVDSIANLPNVLSNILDERLNISQFIDYSSTDGQYRKYRIALIDGVAYPAHMAISSNWMVHYLNAGMTASALKRDEEAKWLNDFHETFAVKHEAAFSELCNMLELDYFAIDCAETHDGRLLIFEIDTAMIIHCMDVEPEFAYKKRPMHKLFAAFQAMLA
ncbi:MAG: tetratricopeptide repeat-containing protein [Aestuariivirga sp.]